MSVIRNTALASLLEKHLTALAVRNYSENTLRVRRRLIGYFLDWCAKRSIEEPVDVTRTVFESYQRYLLHYRKSNGEPLSFRSQHSHLAPLRVAVA